MSDEHRARGFKATLSNPRTSEEAKQHARDELHKLGQDYDPSQAHHHVHHAPTTGYGHHTTAQHHATHHATGGSSTTHTDRDKNEGNVLGGYKATLKNPRVSEEAKEHAQEVLEEHGIKID